MHKVGPDPLCSGNYFPEAPVGAELRCYTCSFNCFKLLGPNISKPFLLFLLLRLETSRQLIILSRKWILDQLSSFSFSHASNIMAFGRGVGLWFSSSRVLCGLEQLNLEPGFSGGLILALKLRRALGGWLPIHR